MVRRMSLFTSREEQALFGSFKFALLLVAVVLVLWCGPLAAAEPVAFAAPVFQPAPKFAAPKCAECGPSCPCPAGACPVACGTEPVQYVQVCENGKCRLVPAPAASSAQVSAGFQCAGGSRRSAAGTEPAAAVFGPCSSGSCAAKSGWYLGTNLGRRR